MSNEPEAITLTMAETLAVIDALDYAANDYAYRAQYEEKSGTEESGDRDAFAAKAAELSKLADTIRFYAGIAVNRP
jgi:hypothetical protein